jgi:acyl-CoA hydrolase
VRVATPDEAAALVRRRDSLALPLGPGQPPSFLEALGRREDFEDLRVFTALLLGLYPLFQRPGVRMWSGFYGPIERALAAQGGKIEFVPADFRRFARIARQLRPRVMATCAASADEQGRFSLALHAGATVDELRACGADPERLLVVEANRRLPRTLGLPPEHPHCLRADEIDVLIETDREVFALEDGKAGEVERAIAEHVGLFVPDGATLQTGIGEIPNAVVGLLAEAPGGDYGVHSEMFTTGLMHLHRAGKVSNRKGLYEGVSVATFALGSQELYRWLDGQEAVRFLPVEAVNDPSVVAHNRSMVSINGALSIDLAGQVVADNLGGVQFSGVGGHEDFVAGAALGAGGHSLVCMPSLAKEDGRRVSRIVRRLPPGAIVTTPRHQVDVVVTEYGVAELAGRSVREREEALIAIAHPDLRDALRDPAIDAPGLA